MGSPGLGEVEPVTRGIEASRLSGSHQGTLARAALLLPAWSVEAPPSCPIGPAPGHQSTLFWRIRGCTLPRASVLGMSS